MVTGGALVSVITWTCQPIHLAAEKQHFLLSIPRPSTAQHSRWYLQNMILMAPIIIDGYGLDYLS